VEERDDDQELRPARGQDPAKSRTDVKMLWDDENLYIWFMALDEESARHAQGQDGGAWSETWSRSSWYPTSPKGSYYELELAPSNEPLALQIAKAKAKRSAACQLDPPYHNFNGDQRHAQQPATRTSSTAALSRCPSRICSTLANKAPAMGDQWRFISARLRPRQTLRQKTSRKLSAAVPLSAVSFHISDEYGTMKFGR